MDTKVLQVVGTLLLVGVLFVAVLSYSNITGFAPVLDQIKDGVAKLVGWFIPPKYNISLESLNEKVTVNGRVFKVENLTASELTTIGYIHIDLGDVKDYYPNVRLVVTGDLSVTLETAASSNCTVVIQGNEISVYPYGGEAKAKIAVKIVGSELSGSIIVSDVRY